MKKYILSILVAMVMGVVFLTSSYAKVTQISSPIPGSTLTTSSVQFQWDAVAGAQQYWINVGTTLGGTNIYAQSVGTNLFVDVANIPMWGEPIYVRLWTKDAKGVFTSADFTYQTLNDGSAPVIATLTSPVVGTTLDATPVTFTWTQGVNISKYFLYIGSSPGAFNLALHSAGANTSAVIDFSLTGQPIYVRLLSQTAYGLQFNDYVFDTVDLNNQGLKHEMLTPVPDSVIDQSMVTFTWGNGNNVEQTYLSVGTAMGAGNMYSGYVTGNSQVVTLVPDGNAIYVRLWSKIFGLWKYNDYTYQTVDLGLVPAPAQIISPVVGDTINTSSVTFQWDQGVLTTQRYLYVGSSVGASDIYYGAQTGGSHTVNNIPDTSDKIYVRMWSRIAGSWQYIDYEYDMLHGPTNIGGVIESDTTLYERGSPYIAIEDITINSGVTLTVEPGTEIKFDGNYKINALGILKAVGTSADPISFTSNQSTPAPGNWQSIRVTNAQSVFKHVRVKYSTNGIHILGSPFDEYDVLIEDSIVEFNTHGIYVEPRARVEIYRNDIMNNNVGLYANYSRLNRFNIKANDNNFENNTAFHLQSGFSNTGNLFSIIDATYNWWGTTDLNTINALIQDSSDGPTHIEVYADVNIDPILGSNTGNAVQITNNSVSTKFVDITQTPLTTINYTLDRNATVTINIYDDSGNLVRNLVNAQSRTAGGNSDAWNCQDDTSTLLSEGLYVYEILADDGAGGQGRYGPQTPNDEGVVTINNIALMPSTSFEPVKGERLSISYQLSDDAIVSVNNGSYSFLQDAPQAQGSHTVYWDGRDLSGNFIFDAAAQIAMSTHKIPETGIALVKQSTLDITSLVADPYLFRPLYSEITQISYTINETSNVVIDVLTPTGLSVVATLENTPNKESGTYNLTWDGTWSDGSPVSVEGDYIIRATLTDSNGRVVVRHGNVRILY